MFLQALLLHNQVIREAAYTNAGHVLAQEGDAFIVGFSEALDAAIFSLQVRHAVWRGCCNAPATVVSSIQAATALVLRDATALGGPAV